MPCLTSLSLQAWLTAAVCNLTGLCKVLPACCRLQGRLLGINDPFLPTVADVAISLSSGCDAAVIPNAERIKRELSTEEEKFRVNLDRGEKMLEDLLQVSKLPEGPAYCQAGLCRSACMHARSM